MTLKDKNGGIIGTLSSGKDITEKRKIREALRASREELEQRVNEQTQENVVEQSRMLEAFFQCSLTSIAFLDKNFNFIRVNEAYAIACRRDISEFAGRNHFELYPSDAEEIFRQVVETKTAYQAVTRPFTFRNHPEWGITYWDWTLLPILDKKGEVDFLVLFIEDVTKRKLAEDNTKKQSELLDLANDAIMISELDGKIIYWNRGAENLYELPRNRAIGKNIDKLINPVALSNLREIQEILLRNGHWEGELIHIKRDGTEVLLDGRWTLKRDDANEPIAFIVINRDITELKRKETELHDSSLYARSLIEASIDPLVTISSDGKIMDVNKATEMITGVLRENLIGSDFSDSFTEPEKAREGYREVFRFGSVRDYALSIRNISGRVTDVIYNATLYRDETGEVQGVFAAARDITDLRRTQAALQKAYDELELRVEQRTNELKIANQALQNEIMERKQAEELIEERTKLLEFTNRELESFSYSVSHDLRAPLRAIDGFSRIILRTQGDKFDEDTLRKFDVIRDNAQMMGQLIDGLLAFSRLGRKDISMSRLDMAGLAGDAWNELQVVNPERKMIMTLRNMPSGLGDRMLIKQVFINLLSNAVKFTKYCDCAHIEVGGYQNGNDDVYYVKDNGIGFDMTYYDKLFGVFQRLHGNDAFEGTGVGLAIVQRIINRHGGRVWAEGVLDQGACFYFSLTEKG